MPENMKLSLRVDAHDDASPVIRKLIANVKELKSAVSKSFGDRSLGLKNARAFAANQSKASDAILRFSKAETSALKFKAKLEGNLRRERERDAASAARSQQKAEKAGLRAIGETIRESAKLARQKVADEQAASRAAVRSIRDRMAFSTRMARQRVAEERTAARESARAERERASAIREAARLDVFRMRLRERHEADIARQSRSARSTAIRSGREAWSRGADSYRTITRTGAGAGLATAAGTGAIVRRSLGVEMDADAAEVNARIYAGLSKQAARDLRQKWAEPLAEQLGTGTEKLLTGYTDAVKLGIPSEGAKAFAGLTVKTSEAWSVPIENVSETLGTINTLLTSTGQQFDFDKIKSVANTLQYLAAKQATTPEKMISFLERGAGAAQVLGMSQEAGLAFGSASTSLGNQAGKSGSLFDYIAGRIIELPKLTKKQGDTGKEAREIVRALGFGSADAMDRQRRADPDAFMPDLLERFNKISNPKVQERVIRNFAGQEWFGEFGRMAKGSSTYKEASQLAKEAQKLDAIGEVWELHKQKLVFVSKQFSAGLRNILGEFGKVLSPIARQVGDEFLKWTSQARSGGLAARIRASIEGFVNGLGFKDVPALLRGILGDPSDASGGAISAWKATFREFAAGLRDVFTAIKSVVSTFAGSDPEVMARWAGRTVALTSALLLLSPVVGVITALATGIIALSAALRGAGALLTALGIGKAAAPASPAVTAAPGLLGRLGSLLGLAGSAAAAPLTLGPSREDQDAMALHLGEWARRKNGEGTGTWIDPPAKSLKDALEEHGKIIKQSFESNSDRNSLIHKTSFSTDSDQRDLKQVFSSQGARLQLANLAGGSTSGLAVSSGGFFGGGSGATGAFGGSGAGSMLGNIPGQAFGAGGSRRGIIGGGSAPQGSGKGTRGPANTGSMMSWAVDQLRREGVPEGQLKQAAAHLVGQATMESGLDPSTLHDGGTGYGIYGARDPRPGVGRRTNMLNWLKANGYAANSAEGQMREMVHSAMSGRYRRTRAILMGQGSGNLEADTNTITKEFESPKIVNRRSGAVQNAFNVGPNGSPNEGGNASGVNSASGGDIVGNMRSLRSSGRVINEQCVALAKAAVGVSGSVTTWRKGVGAEEGSLKPGTPIATFLDRQGLQSERYAGGGTGSMGANRDHAAVFSGYIRDKAGKIVGMNVADQWKGSGGIRDSRYLFGDRRGGAKDARNYHAILGSDGQPLGGDRNPLSARDMAGSPWSPGAGGNAAALAKSAAPTAESLAKTVPNRVSEKASSMTGGGSGGPQVHAPITINGGHHDAESLANMVQKRINESLNTRTHDKDYRSI